MALGLGIIPDKIRGDMDEVKRLLDVLQKIASQDYRGNRSTESQLAFHALNTPNGDAPHEPQPHKSQNEGRTAPANAVASSEIVMPVGKLHSTGVEDRGDRLSEQVSDGV
jgi:hypothetical protein